jgi:hypothetical protein
MVDRFLDFDVKLLAAGCLADDIAWLAPIGVTPATRTGLLGIASHVLD